MRTSKLVFLAGFASVATILLNGCITHDSTVTHDTERVKIEFQNDTAARVFYEALSRRSPQDNNKDSTTKFEIPIVFEYKRHVVTGSNAAFNRAVELCDSNKNGTITEQEARIFSEQNPR
jgi:hypothetical protein